MAGKKVLIVYAHQEPRSFNGSLKDVAVAELSRQGCTVTVSDLYAMDFEPRATRKDITGALSSPEFFSYGVEAYEACKTRSLTSDIIAEQKKVQEADLVMFQFPLYWFSVPAVLKGWMDRVLCQGFAFDLPGFYDDGLLKGKLAILSLTTGGTADMYGKTGASGDFRYFLWPLQDRLEPWQEAPRPASDSLVSGHVSMEPGAGRLPGAHPHSRSPGLGSGPRSQVDAGLPLLPGPGVGEDGGQRKRPARHAALLWI
ncbi:ribosyldihydronicotinamide dehydrogenase [quinone] isoform X1 [Eubalaena glacialis]|uniref:ribosyldihydronicotinamide dehydrogenase [quinone] isoform X1 n=1 Tax=Eubalaena glacialis TaxID=27606 RepID=UPI002A5A037F|nr:ribosyldihydronicotinamide dehydrogenase [quinone] isoform X1 [Eubalaena glacialis]